jgi:2-(1,2-epoxy-1,2-dihydrophenyl)acetyl-CoA isomerase
MQSKDQPMSVEISVSDHVASILFNRPDKLNAFTDGMWLQLRDHLDRCANDDEIRSVLISGAGRGFCAGADISGEGKVITRKPGIAGIQQMMEFYSAIVQKLYHLPKPTIAAVHGPAVGIAWTMALCCDWLLTTETAKFRPAFMNLAKVPEGGFQFLLARQIGAFKARDLVYRSRFTSGAEAFELGLASQLVAEDALMDEAAALGSEAAALAPAAFKSAKQLFNETSGDFDGFIARELAAITITASMTDAKEGMAAFSERRSANFTGT